MTNNYEAIYFDKATYRELCLIYKCEQTANLQYFIDFILPELKSRYEVTENKSENLNKVSFSIHTHHMIFEYFPYELRLKRYYKNKSRNFPCNFNGFHKLFLNSIMIPDIDDCFFVFGRYKNMSIYKIQDDEYLDWLLKGNFIKEDMRNKINEFLKYGVILKQSESTSSQRST